MNVEAQARPMTRRLLMASVGLLALTLAIYNVFFALVPDPAAVVSPLGWSLDDQTPEIERYQKLRAWVDLAAGIARTGALAAAGLAGVSFAVARIRRLVARRRSNTGAAP